MSHTTLYRINCDDRRSAACHGWIGGDTLKKTREKARSVGWVSPSIDNDICPTCCVVRGPSSGPDKEPT